MSLVSTLSGAVSFGVLFLSLAEAFFLRFVRGGEDLLVECGESFRTIDRPLRVLLVSL